MSNTQYCGERLNDGSILSLYRNGRYGYEEYDIFTDTWNWSDDARDAFNGGFAVKNLSEEEAMALIDEWKSND